MYVDYCRTQGKYKRYLLRESFRQNGHVKHRTIANLSGCSPEEIRAIQLALSHKEQLEELLESNAAVELQQGLSVGAVWLVYQMARQLGIAEALGNTREGKLALWQVLARVIEQGSRLSAVRLAGGHAACDILGLETGFNEEHLYRNLDWLEEQHARIEGRLYRRLYPAGQRPELFLYDVTSTYLEGVHNEWAAFGYNRDGKKGKMQIIVGLLCDQQGRPLAIEVFAGNTRDPATVAAQIRKLAEQFGGGEVTFVGDRGMLKSQQVEDLLTHGLHYITAITKPQIETLLAEETITMSLFDQVLAEVQTDEGVRYILRRNPLRAQEMQTGRESKLARVRLEALRQTEYLAEHPRAKGAVALRKAQAKARQLKISDWIQIEEKDRQLEVRVDSEALAATSKLDGCYVLKTDLTASQCAMEVVHARYKALALVEWAFRTSKTVELEMRPVYVRLAERTSAHALVVMLAYRIVQELAERWGSLNLTIEEGLKELATLCAIQVLVKGQPRCNQIPQPRPKLQQLLDLARVRLPQVLPCKGIHVATRKKLQENRKKR
jgi:transposase